MPANGRSASRGPAAVRLRAPSRMGVVRSDKRTLGIRGRASVKARWTSCPAWNAPRPPSAGASPRRVRASGLRALILASAPEGTAPATG